MGNQRTDRIVVLDGLRLIAALMVALFHYIGRTKTSQLIWEASPQSAFPQMHHVAQYGWLGVELFFLISGFVICMSAWGRETGSFIRSRAIRLFPAYWPAVLITTVVGHLWPFVVAPRPNTAVLVNLTMLQWPLGVNAVDGVYWTLWCEVRFYLLFALIVWRGLTLQRAMWFGYGWLLASAIAVSANEPLLKVVLQPAYAPLFIAGIGFYLIHRFGSSLKLWGLVVASFLLAQHNMVARVAAEEKERIFGPLSVTAANAVLALFFVIMTVVALGWTSRIKWRWLTTAGLLTYPFYLIHENIGWVIIHAVHGHAPRSVIVVATIALMLGAAWLLHRFVERPIAGLMRRHLTPPKPVRPRPVATPTPPQAAPHEREPAGV